MIIYRYLIKDRGITVEDLLDPDPRHSKLRWTVFEYDPQTFQSKVQLSAYQDEDDARTVATFILTGRLPSEYTEYKGSERDGQVESRVFGISYNPDTPKPYRISIRRGPGERLPTGAVKPMQGAQFEQTSIMLDEFEASKMALAILECIRAFWTSRYHELKEARSRTGKED